MFFAMMACPACPFGKCACRVFSNFVCNGFLLKRFGNDVFIRLKKSNFLKVPEIRCDNESKFLRKTCFDVIPQESVEKPRMPRFFEAPGV